MIRRAIPIIFLSAIILNCTAQDLMVTSHGDSINCKITKVKPDFIYITFKYKDEIRSSLIPVEQVRIYKYNYFTVSEVPADRVIGHDNFTHTRLALNLGYSTQTGKIDQNQDPQMIDYLKKLKSGFNLGGNVSYFFSESMGCGIDYRRFTTSNSVNGIYLQDEYGHRQFGNMADDITVSLFGPSLTTRFNNVSRTNAFLLTYAFGFMTYRNNAVLIKNYTMTGNTFGMSMDIGYDLGISKSLKLGFQLSLISGMLGRYDLNDGISTRTIQLEKGEYESLYRFDLSVGLRFN